MTRKERRKYLFSVEGKTEQWYLEWLQEQINGEEQSTYLVALTCSVEPNPLRRVKSLPILGKTEITHWCDFESEQPEFERHFLDILSQMKNAQSLGKKIIYHLGYSNLTFELWMILHKRDCFGAISDRTQYLQMINQAYGVNFETLDQYKSEDNFRRLLRNLSLSEVIQAICRAKTIMQSNPDLGYRQQQYKGYCYYRENPSLTIWESVETILVDCGLHQKA